jgi:tetratricopeptide (TPR) repeat protein
MAAEDWETAWADLEWLVENYPDLSGPYLNLALLHSAQGNVDEAEASFKAAIDVNPSNLSAYNQYAIFLREQGRFDDAEAIYLSALEVWDDHAETHLNLGVLYDLYRGEHERALQHYHRYQDLTGNEDRTVAGWIIVLERQFSQVVQRGEE